MAGISYFTLPSQEDPNIVNREAIVTTKFPWHVSTKNRASNNQKIRGEYS